MNATAAIVSAKMKLPHVGEVPRWIGASSVCGSKNSARPSTTMNSCSARSATTSAPTRRARRQPKPRMLANTTNAITANDSGSASSWPPSGLQKTRRYWVVE